MKPTSAEPDVSDERERDLRIYWSHRSRCNRALLVGAVAVATLIVFNKPQNWGWGGGEGYLVYYSAWFVLVVTALIAWVYVTKMSEQRGYCRGKYGITTFAFREDRDRVPDNRER